MSLDTWFVFISCNFLWTSFNNCSTFNSVLSVILLIGCTSTQPRPLCFIVGCFTINLMCLTFFNCFFVCPYCCSVTPLSYAMGESWASIKMLYHATFCNCRSSEEPLTFYFSFVDSFFFAHEWGRLIFLFNGFTIFISVSGYYSLTLLIVEGRTMPYSKGLCHLVSWEELYNLRYYFLLYYSDYSVGVSSTYVY